MGKRGRVEAILNLTLAEVMAGECDGVQQQWGEERRAVRCEAEARERGKKLRGHMGNEWGDTGPGSIEVGCTRVCSDYGSWGWMAVRGIMGVVQAGGDAFL